MTKGLLEDLAKASQKFGKSDKDWDAANLARQKGRQTLQPEVASPPLDTQVSRICLNKNFLLQEPQSLAMESQLEKC